MTEEKIYDESYYQKFIGKTLGTKGYRIRGRKMSNFSEALDDTRSNYYVPKPADKSKPDFSKIEAHPAYASTYTVPGILSSLPDLADEDGNKLVTNIYKLLHTGQKYSYDGCVPLKDSVTKVYTKGIINKAWINKGMLWVEIGKTTQHHQKGKVFRAECQMRLPGKSIRSTARRKTEARRPP